MVPRTVSVDNLRSFHFLEDVYPSQPIFILGNGPSLSKQDLSLLDGFITIGTNRIYEIYEPTFWVGLDFKMADLALQHRWQRDTWITLREGQLKKLHQGSRHFETYCKGEFVIYQVNSGSICSNVYDPWGLRGSASSAIVATNAAFVMGADPIVFVGIDLSTDKPEQTHFYSGRTLHQDKSRWFQGYDIITGERRWSNAAMTRMRLMFQEFKPLAEKASVRVFNATEGGILDGFPTPTLKEVCDMYAEKRNTWTRPAKLECEKWGEEHYRVGKK